MDMLLIERLMYLPHRGTYDSGRAGWLNELGSWNI
jgi:hypothetical protein